MVCQSTHLYKHAVIALLQNAQSVASDVKYAFIVASQHESYEKDRTSTFPHLISEGMEALLYSGLL